MLDFACRVLGQLRFTQRKISKTTDDDAALTAEIISLAIEDGRDGFHLAPDVFDRLRQRQLRIFGGELEKMSIGKVFQSGCEFHEEIARGVGYPFFVEALKRVNSIRRLFAYQSFADRKGIRRHIKEHLRLLDLLEAKRYADAAELIARHLRRPLLTSAY